MSPILSHLRIPRTEAELARLTSLSPSEVASEIRRLGSRIERIKPTTIHDRAIRYRAINDAPAKRDPARPPVSPERRDVHRDPDPAPLPVDLPEPRAGDVVPDAGDNRGCEDGRAADDRSERTPDPRRALGSFEVDRETIPLGLAICLALEGDGTHLNARQIAEAVAEMRGPTMVEAVQKALTDLRARRMVRRAPAKMSLTTGRKSARWAIASRGKTWKGGVKASTRKRAILAALASGPATIAALSDLVAGLHRTRAVAIMAELANAGKVIRSGFGHIRDASGRRRRVIVWALGPL
jgi:hypothetical protein